MNIVASPAMAQTGLALSNINGHDLLGRTTAPTRWEIELLQQEVIDLVKAGIEEMKPSIVEEFKDGMYIREMSVPPGIIIGKRHKTAHINFLVKGEITIWSEDGVKHLIAPAMYVSSANTQKVGWAHTDVVWTTMHITDCSNFAEIEDVLTEPSSNFTRNELQTLIAYERE